MNDWILCTDRLPSIGERVTVVAVHNRTGSAIIDMLRYHGQERGWDSQDICTVVAWMPLPKLLENIDQYLFTCP